MAPHRYPQNQKKLHVYQPCMCIIHVSTCMRNSKCMYHPSSIQHAWSHIGCIPRFRVMWESHRLSPAPTPGIRDPVSPVSHNYKNCKNNCRTSLTVPRPNRYETSWVNKVHMYTLSPLVRVTLSLNITVSGDRIRQSRAWSGPQSHGLISWQTGLTTCFQPFYPIAAVDPEIKPKIDITFL